MIAFALTVLLLLGAPNTPDVRLGAKEIAAVCRHEPRPRLCVKIVATIWKHEARFVRVPRRRGGGCGPLQVAGISSALTCDERSVPAVGFAEGFRVFKAKMKRAKGDLRGAFVHYSGRPKTKHAFAAWATGQLGALDKALRRRHPRRVTQEEPRP